MRWVRPATNPSDVALEHRVLRRGELLHLEVVVHHREGGATRFLCGPGGRGERGAEAAVPTRKGEVHEVQTEFHRVVAPLMLERIP